MLKGKIPEFLLSTYIAIHHMSGKRNVTGVNNTSTKCVTYLANCRDKKELELSTILCLETSNTNFVQHMRSIQAVIELNNQLVATLEADPMVRQQHATLYEYAKEQKLSLDFLLGYTGRVHLTVVASIAKKLGISDAFNGFYNQEQAAPPPPPPPHQIVIKKEIVTPPPQEMETIVEQEEEDDDEVIEIVDEEQQRQLAILTAASVAENAVFVAPNSLVDTSTLNAEPVDTSGENADIQIISESEEKPFFGPPTLEDSILSGKLPTLNGNTDRPYWLVIKDDVGGRPTFMATAGMSSGRDTDRKITSETYVTLPRQIPWFVQQMDDVTLSMYANWQTPVHNDSETRMNLSFMGMVSLKPRTGQHKFWKYTTANKDQGQYRMTHSSFWDFRTKLRERNSSMTIPEEKFELTEEDAREIERLVGGPEAAAALFAATTAAKEESGVSIPVLKAPEEPATTDGPNTANPVLLMRSPRPPTPVLTVAKKEEKDEASEA